MGRPAERIPAVVQFGRRVRRHRDELGWTQERLAAEAGLHPVYVAGVERGERNVSLVTILKVARALGVEAGALVDGLPRPSRRRPRH